MSIDNTGWASTGSTVPFILTYNYRIFVTLASKDKCTDPNCCVLIQWVTCTQTINGSRPAIGGGETCDGDQHIDMNPYHGDNPFNPLNQYAPTTLGPHVIYNDDTPDFSCNHSGDVLAGGDSFVFTVYDKCNGMRPVRSTNLDLTVTGTCPSVTAIAVH